MTSIYHHLTYAERCQIKVLLSTGESRRSIAKALNRSVSTISRETVRNSGLRGYSHKLAENKALKRRHEASSAPRKLTEELRQRIEGLLRDGWSPEQVAGRLRHLGELEGRVHTLTADNGKESPVTRRSRPGWGGVLFHDAVSLLGTWPERACQRPGA